MNKTTKKNVLSSIDGHTRKKPTSKLHGATPTASEAEGVSDSHLAGVDEPPSRATRSGCREPFALIFTRQGGRSMSPDDELLGSDGQPLFRSH